MLFSVQPHGRSAVRMLYVVFPSGSVLVTPNISFFLALVIVKQDGIHQRMAILLMASLLLTPFSGLISDISCRIRNRPEKEYYPNWHYCPRYSCCGVASEISSKVLPSGQLLYSYVGPAGKVSSSSYLICSYPISNGFPTPWPGIPSALGQIP
jgi:hypothetical protein